MTLRETWLRVRAARERGPHPTPGDLDSIQDSGKEWVVRMVMDPYNVELDELVDICRDIENTTLVSLMKIGPQLPLEMRLRAAVAAGFSNGLALGLEHAQSRNNRTGVDG